MATTERRDERLRKLFASLPRLQAPPGFEEGLARRVAARRPRHSFIPAWLRAYTVPALSLLLVGVISYAVYMTQFRNTGDAVPEPPGMKSAPDLREGPATPGRTPAGTPPGAGDMPGLGSRPASAPAPGIQGGPPSAAPMQARPEPAPPEDVAGQAPQRAEPSELYRQKSGAARLTPAGAGPGGAGLREIPDPNSPGILATPRGFFHFATPRMIQSGKAGRSRVMPERSLSDSAGLADSLAGGDGPAPDTAHAQPGGLRDTLREHAPPEPDRPDR